MLDNYADGMDISGQQHQKEHRSLDVLNLLNLSASAQEQQSACPKGISYYFRTPKPSTALFFINSINLNYLLLLLLFFFFLSFYKAPGRKDLDVNPSTREYKIKNSSPVILLDTVVPANFVRTKDASMLSVRPYI